VKPIRKLKSLLTATALLLALRADSLLACSVCYGQSDSPMARGMNWGILSLLGVIGGVLAGVTLFFVHVGRRSAAIAQTAGASGETPEKNI